VPFAGTPTCADGYLVNSLNALVVIDPDGDTTGARIIGDKPVALTYGLETDTTGGGTGNLDLGYAAYPAKELFLDAVLTIDKSTDRTAVPMSGGIVTYTLRVDSYCASRICCPPASPPAPTWPTARSSPCPTSRPSAARTPTRSAGRIPAAAAAAGSTGARP
jgi:hypothetical protein